MKLLFHIGVERTGSSHLQSLSAINRTALQQNGIWFPFAGKRDSHMLNGEISPGNSQTLTDALFANDYTVCEFFIAQRVNEAKKNACHTLLLSNELLMLALAEDDNLSQFISMLHKMDISNISFLLFLRDPVDHAYSLYKHRAKNGRALDIEEWPRENYLYGKALGSFFKRARAEKICLRVRKFSIESGALEKIFFEEWLNVHEDLIYPPKYVNPSLSLSNLVLLKIFSQNNSYFTGCLYRNLINISKNNKCANTEIIAYYKETLSIALANYKDTWEICNQFLPFNEKLSIPSQNINQRSVIEKNYCFSDVQMEALRIAISDSRSLKGRFLFQKLKIKSLIVRLLETLSLKNKL